MPENSIRKKLSAVFEYNKNTSALKKDATWIDFESWHWLTGRLTTQDGNHFVVKASVYPPGHPIVPDNPLWDTQIHSAQQNLSRIIQSQKARYIIKKYALDTIRVPRCWVYPISGNNNDLDNENLTDDQTIIVEEFIDASQDTTWCQLLKSNVQAATLQLDRKTFNQLIYLAYYGKFPDLHPKNFVIDSQGNIVLIDLEDLLAFERELIKKSNSVLKLFTQLKFFIRQWSEALEGVGITGKTQQINRTIQAQGNILYWLALILKIGR